MHTRRTFLKLGIAASAAMLAPWHSRVAQPASARGLSRQQRDALANFLSDPATQPKFSEIVPNALDPGFMYTPKGNEYTVGMGLTEQETGLLGTNGHRVSTALYGYGESDAGGHYVYTWPGKTFEIQRNAGTTVVNWENNLSGVTSHLLPVDTSLHWCYSLADYTQHSIASAGVPVIPHLHGGHTDFLYDGNPEYFWNPGASVVGPRWGNAFTNKFVYSNDVPAGNLWYHDHALGITRLNVYAGLAGFYFVRDEEDTGKADNPLGLPAFPYELAYAIQDRMFYNDGRLFYSAYPGDPFYADFITDEEVELPNEFVGGGPTALAEFFGDHMLVNGKIWPKADVEPRRYRMRLLNGCDSRFMVLHFRVAESPSSETLDDAGERLPFWVIGSDQGLAEAAVKTDTLIFEPGGRYDIVFDFSQVPFGSRVIMENSGPDAPFGGKYDVDLDHDDLFPDRQTDRIMAFDVTQAKSAIEDRFDPDAIDHFRSNPNPVTRTRKVALFEGQDEYGRLQPVLGTAEPATNYQGTPLNYMMGSVAGTQINGAVAWHEVTTENPALGSTEIWEIYNATMDAHPVHLHLVNFEILDRRDFTANSVEQVVVQHNGETGTGYRLENIQLAGATEAPNPIERSPKDMVTALPGQMTRIKATFDKPGRYVWHCHILSHEDHEMMRVLNVGREIKPVLTMEVNFWRSDRKRGQESIVLFDNERFSDTDGARGRWFVLGQRTLILAYDAGVKCGAVLVGTVNRRMRYSGIFSCTDGSRLWGIFAGEVSAMPPMSFERAMPVIDETTQSGIDFAGSTDICATDNADFRSWIVSDPAADAAEIDACQQIFLPIVR